MKLKKCHMCSEEKEATPEFFPRNRTRKDGLLDRCKVCNRERQREHYRANKASYVEKAKRNNAKYDQEKFDFLVEYLQKNPCMDCGEADLVVLEFDHLRDKKWNVSKLVNNGTSLKNFQDEIAKCEVVCANCHRRRTATRAGWRKTLISP